MHPTRLPLAAALLLVVVALTGCSGDGVARPVETTETTEAAGWQPPSPVPRLLPADLDGLRDHCLDRRGFDDATGYAGEGPHPLVVFDLETRGAGGLGSLADESLPGSWLAERPQDAVLVACVRTADGDTRLGECRYSAQIIGTAPDATVPMYSRNYRVRIYDLQLPARQVADLTVEATEGGCPERIEYTGGEPPERVMPELTGTELRAALEEVVTGPG